ncbi:hypothetical protein ACX1N5_15010, partial [Acinetobacter sp. ANC 4636]
KMLNSDDEIIFLSEIPVQGKVLYQAIAQSLASQLSNYEIYFTKTKKPRDCRISVITKSGKHEVVAWFWWQKRKQVFKVLLKLDKHNFYELYLNSLNDSKDQCCKSECIIMNKDDAINVVNAIIFSSEKFLI